MTIDWAVVVCRCITITVSLNTQFENKVAELLTRVLASNFASDNNRNPMKIHNYHCDNLTQGAISQIEVH